MVKEHNLYDLNYFKFIEFFLLVWLGVLPILLNISCVLKKTMSSAVGG